MSLLQDLSFGYRRKLPVLLQGDTAESGLACLSMIAAYYGYRVDIASLRRGIDGSPRGLTAANLMRIAQSRMLATRPLKMQPEEVAHLRTPCVLEWGTGHFVVLRELRRGSVIIHDPASGVRKVSAHDVREHATGVALEIWPDEGFETQPEEPRVSLGQLLGRVRGVYRGAAKVVAMVLALEFIRVVSPLFLQWVVDDVIRSASLNLLTTLALGFGLLMILQAAIAAARSRVLMSMSATLNVQWHANTLTHLLRLPVEYFQKRSLGDVRSRFMSVDQIVETLSTKFVTALLDGFVCVVTCALMFSYSAALGAVAVGIVAIYTVFRWLTFRSLRDATAAQVVHTARQDSHLLETIQGVKPIKLFQREDQRRTTWLGLFVDQVNASLQVQKLHISYTAVNGLLLGLENILIIWLGARMVIDGNITVGMLLAFKAYKDQFDSRISSLVDALLQFSMLRVHGARLSDIVLSERERSSESTTSRPHGELSADIRVSNLFFRYSQHEPMVLKGIDLEIRAGESVALVGNSGCGKSTLMHVMLGIIEPTSGDIEIGGVSTRKWGLYSLRTLIGTVTQDDTLLAGSIADNISCFDPDADSAWIEECARAAAIHEEIAAMPMGYHSLVGDMGTTLSGGQRQRVLLARALYKKPKILLLDEATSHLDLHRERLVNAAIQALSITRVIIAHRPESIGSAERVVTLVDGRISMSSTPLSLQRRLASASPAPMVTLARAPAFMRMQ